MPAETSSNTGSESITLYKKNRKECANAIRALSMDAVQQANSGHPGAPMGMADIAEVLWNDYLQHNPTNPNWINRDRFVLSNGHGSMLIYSLHGSRLLPLDLMHGGQHCPIIVGLSPPCGCWRGRWLCR